MRTTIGIAMFCIVGAGAVGVSALALKGSDTLKDLTIQLLTSSTLDCGGLGNTPAGTLSYIGTGSGNGQSAMLGHAQEVAPMSSRLSSAVCPTDGSASKAEGIVFALDGISIVGDSNTNGACAGSLQQATDGSQCGADSPAKGLAFDGSLACGYTLTDWKDVLRLLYFGFQHTTTTDVNAQNCNDPCRTELANNYAKLFEGSCTPGNGCTQVWHAFRRNDESGTTDVFIKSLAGFPGIDQQNNYTPFCNSATIGPKVTAVGVACTTNADCTRGPVAGTCDTANGRCSALSCTTNADCTDATGAVIPVGTGGTQPCGGVTANQCEMTHIVTPQTALANHAGPGLPYNEIGETPPTTPVAGGLVDQQDGDPIRRTCVFGEPARANTETVCGNDGTATGSLGLVLPIYDATSPDNNIAQADAFPAAACNTGSFACAPALRISRTGRTNRFAICPDGKDPNVKPNGSLCPINTCYTPFTGPVATPNFACINTRGNVGVTGLPDGRVFNLTVWKNNVVGLYPRSTGQGPLNVAGTSNLTPMYRGAFFRLHQNFVRTGSVGTPCQAVSATDQISCLVQASPCSLGYAGNSAVHGNTIAINVNNVAPSNACIQNLLLKPTGIADPATYKISRNLYLNTVAGFETLSGSTDKNNELKLAQCYANASVAESIATTTFGFIPLPTGHAPFCDDVASAVCHTAGACTGNPTGIPSTGF